MKVALSVEVTDVQRRALSGTKRLATRDEVRAYVEGALGQLGASPTPVGSTAHNPISRVPIAPSASSPELEAQLDLYREKGWGEEALAAYVRGWQLIK